MFDDLVYGIELTTQEEQLTIQENQSIPDPKGYSIHSLFEEMEQLKIKIETLTDQINTLKQETITNEHLDHYVTHEEINNLNEDIDELSDIVKENELKTCLDRVNITAELRTRSDWFSFKGYVKENAFSINDKKYTYERVHASFTNRLRFNVESKLFKNTRFYSIMGVYYHWLNQKLLPTSNFYHLNLETEPSNTMMKVERAYVDLFLDWIHNLPIAISFGRLPVSEGLPTNLRENTPRKSTFPSIAYDTMIDGIGLSFELSHIVPLPDPYLRLMFCRMNLLNDKEVYRSNPYGLENSNGYLAQFETCLPGNWNKAQFMIYYTWYDKISPRSTIGPLTIPSGSQLLPPPFNPTQKDISVTLIPISEVYDSLGRGNKLTFYLQINDFLFSGIDWFATYNTTRTTPTNKPVVYGTYLANIDEDIANQLGNRQIPLLSMGLLSDTNDQPHMGYAIHCGFRYNFPLPKLNFPKVGFEYVNTSKYWIGFTHSSEDPLHKLDTRGDAWDMYYIQPVNKSVTLRFGHTVIRHDYDKGLGIYYNSPNPIDWKISNTYVLIDAKF